MNVKIATLAALVALVSASWGGVMALDARYVGKQQFEDFHWAMMKGQIRDLIKEIEKARGTEEWGFLMEDLQNLLDRFCRDYPNDRACERVE